MSLLKRRKKTEKPTEEKVGQVKPQQGKDLTSPLRGSCLEECPQPQCTELVLAVVSEVQPGRHGESVVVNLLYCPVGSTLHNP